MSITSDPAAAPATTPSSPSITCSTSGVSGSIVTTTSDARATSAGDVGAFGARVHERVDRSRAPRMHGQREPRRQEMPGHGRAHDAEPDEPDPLPHGGRYASTAASAISSARSMISKPSVICSSVMGSGGFVISVHQWIIV